jgi:MinD-like ATPase involved in chromosome partitioning or flagellar assembly
MIETPPNAACQFITFYSYKGGTGRSMLLANVAWLLACNGERVLVIDWDLEAPGIHRYFHPFLTDKALTSTEGLIDGLSRFVEAAVSSPESVEDSEDSQQDAVDDPDWYKLYANLQSYAVPINWSFQGRGKLDLIGAGRQGPMYGTKVNLFDWRQFYSDFAGREFLNTARDLLKDKYDYVLIDSRTGVSDTSGICTTQLPDTLVVCFTLNNQSIEGAYSVAAGASQARTPENKLSVVPVPTRVDPFESEKVELGRELSRVRFQPLVPMNRLSPSTSEEKQIQQYWGDVEVPYVPKYAYEEVLACFSDMPHLKSSVLSSAEQVAKLLRGKLTEMVPVPEEVRSTVLKNFARKPYRVAIAESFAEHLSAPDLDQLRRVLVRLVQVAPVSGSTIVDVPCPSFLADFSGDEELATLQQAKEHSLVVFSKDAAGYDIVKLIDERLVLGWPRLAEWINSDRDFLAWLPEVTKARRTWIDSGMEPDDLLTGTSLAQAARWLQARRKDLRPGEISFIEQCQSSDEALRTAAEAEIANVGLQRKVQTIQSHRVREELEAKDRELEVATAAYKQLSESVRTSGKSSGWVLTKAIAGILASIAVALFLWLRYSPKPASPAPAPQIVLVPEAHPSTDKEAAPDINTGSDTFAVQRACKGVSVNLYANSISDPETRGALTHLWEQQYGLTTTIKTVGSRQQPANSIWHGSDVQSGCWKVVAFSLTRAGFFVSDLGAPEHDITGKQVSIDIGYSARGLSLPPLAPDGTIANTSGKQPPPISHPSLATRASTDAIPAVPLLLGDSVNGNYGVLLSSDRDLIATANGANSGIYEAQLARQLGYKSASIYKKNQFFVTAVLFDTKARAQAALKELAVNKRWQSPEFVLMNTWCPAKAPQAAVSIQGLSIPVWTCNSVDKRN